MPVLAGAQVKAVGSNGQSVAMATDAQGTYSLALPVGSFTLSVSSAGFQDASASGAVASGQLTRMPDLTLKTAPWAVSGLATDGRGNAVPGLAVTLEVGDAYFSKLTGVSNSSGQYRIASTVAHFDSVTVSADAVGFDVILPQQLPCCAAPADTVLDFHLARILRVDATGPGTLRVGEAVELPVDTIFLDNNTQRTVYVKPGSSAPSVVGVESGSRGWVIRGLQPGSAVLTFDYRGVVATLGVQVVQDGPRN
jgi:hypothetical protein